MLKDKLKIPSYEEFEKEFKRGTVRKYTHKTLPLTGYCYSVKCEMDRKWNDINKWARGIVFNEKRKLVALPFPKFFNLGQKEETQLQNLPDLPFEATIKEDGSLMIIFNYKDQWICATKGSFYSEQAEWGNNHIQSTGLNEKLDKLDKNLTILCEGIYIENKLSSCLVVDYKGFTGFKLLSVYDRDKKMELWNERKEIAQSLDLECAETKEEDNLKKLVTITNRASGEELEGFVVRYENGQRVKIKNRDYLRIQKMLTRATPLAVWEALEDLTQDHIDLKAAPYVPMEYWSNFPDESFPKLKEYESELRNKYENFLVQIIEAKESVEKIEYRKELFLTLSKNTNKKISSWVMYLLDGKLSKLDDSIKKEIRPKNNSLEDG